MKHAKGPWAHGTHPAVVKDAWENMVCQVFATDTPIGAANKALVILVPEMLEALQDACEVLQRATTDDSDTETAVLHNRILELLRRLENDNAI